MYILETILYDYEQQHFYLLDYHFQRLWRSMCYFNYLPPFTIKQSQATFYTFFCDYLKHIQINVQKLNALKIQANNVNLSANKYCVRILVNECGNIQHTVKKLANIPVFTKDNHVQLVLAKHSIELYPQQLYHKIHNIHLWTHKTTQREHYNYFFDLSNNNTVQNFTDVILYSADGYITECTKANIALLSKNDGIWYTPTIHNNALAGTMRQYLLYHKKIQFKQLHINDIANAQGIIWFNALRGIMPAQIIMPYTLS